MQLHTHDTTASKMSTTPNSLANLLFQFHHRYSKMVPLKINLGGNKIMFKESERPKEVLGQKENQQLLCEW